MRDFKAIIKELKLYLAKGEEKRVLDKDVASALKLSQAKFATIKRRNSTPYEHILRFSQDENLCSNEIFFE
jgi:ribosomal protein RSM22 (predicted rRNA methylase)